MRKSFPDQFDPPNPIFECSFSTLSCDFKSSEPTDVEEHMKTSYKEHIDLLLSSYLKTQYQWEPSQKSLANGEKEDFPQQSTGKLIQSMYERIVVLEQQNREQSLKIEKLQLMETNRNGTLVWRIEGFKKKYEMMQSNSVSQMFYSAECFTEPNGYKFCARINLAQKVKDCLSLYVHLMKSDNDYHLSWPFVGRIKISMINKDASHSKDDILMTKPEILAFHRPNEDISPRGYGFMEYANIADIVKRGFIINDCLTIKIHVNIV